VSLAGSQLLLAVTALVGLTLAPAQGQSFVELLPGVTMRDGLLSVDVRGVPLRELLRAVGEKAGIRVQVSDEVTEQVSASFAGVPLDEAIRRLCRWNSFVMVFARPEDAAGKVRLTEIRVFQDAGSPAWAEPPSRPGSSGLARSTPQESDASDSAQFRWRLGAVSELGKPQNDAAVPGLTSTLTSDQDHRIRGEAAAALSRVRSPSALTALLEGVTDEHFWVRRRVVEALGRFRDDRARAALEQIARDDSDPRVRARAARALSSLE